MLFCKVLLSLVMHLLDIFTNWKFSLCEILLIWYPLKISYYSSPFFFQCNITFFFEVINVLNFLYWIFPFGKDIIRQCTFYSYILIFPQQWDNGFLMYINENTRIYWTSLQKWNGFREKFLLHYGYRILRNLISLLNLIKFWKTKYRYFDSSMKFWEGL